MEFDAGIRFNNRVHVSFQLDVDSGDMFVTVNMIMDDGTPQVITGTVQWDND